MYAMTAGKTEANMSMSKVDREFYSIISILLMPKMKFTDRYYEALDELKHVWRSYHDRN